MGHFDRQGGGDNPTSWNSAHASQGLQPAEPGGDRRGRPVLLLRQRLNRPLEQGAMDCRRYFRSLAPASPAID